MAKKRQTISQLSLSLWKKRQTISQLSPSLRTFSLCDCTFLHNARASCLQPQRDIVILGITRHNIVIPGIYTVAWFEVVTGLY